ncbi:barstar family protein [Streptomyces monomycini]|uniref:barstar family protein n=1 Tax=Streptomyces monomycini TaxID=371720 RepID=UPI00067E3EF0|nr:barstar family protein [Streptomyces monomycini]
MTTGAAPLNHQPEHQPAHAWPPGVHRADTPAYALAGTADDSTWGVCADVTGLYADPPRKPYELLGCVPAGPLRAAVRAGTGQLGDIWLRPERPERPQELARPQDPERPEDPENPERPQNPERPEADTRCPADSGRPDAWRLLDARVTGVRRHPADAARWDISIDGVEDDYGEPADPYLEAGVTLHDGRALLGHCRDLSTVLPPDEAPTGPPFQLLGCAPGPALGAALATGTRRSLHLDEAELRILDRTGGLLTDRLVSAADITAWRPSALGDGLLDIDLTRGPWPRIPTWARPLWTRWLTGPPAEPDLWAGYSTRERGQWLDIVRERGCRHAGHTPDRPPGGVHDLDGRRITDVPGLYCALGEAVNGPGGYFGANLDALDDCLTGRFGTTTPFTLRWHHSHVARRHLSHRITPDGRPCRFFDQVLAVLAGRQVEVVLR